MESGPTFAQSYDTAKGHGKAFLQSTIGDHPLAAALVMGALVVLSLVLGYYVMLYRGKSGFHVAPISNLTTGNNNPLWWHGSMDAGNWGPVHRDATAWNVAAYHPGWRAGATRWAGRQEGYASGPGGCGSGACAPGETAVTYEDPDCGAKMTYCRVTDALPGPPTVCGRGWDPAASAEAQALATVGSLAHGSYGERRLMGAVDGAFDSNLGLSDEQLSCLMHQGGAP